MTFVKWFGGKSKFAPIIENLLPKKISNYIEPFVGGGGAILFHLLENKIVTNAVICDNNITLIKCYRKIQNDVHSLIDELRQIETTYNALENLVDKKKYYLELRQSFNEHKTECLFISLNKLCFNGLYRVNYKDKFNTTFGQRVTLNINSDHLIKLSQLLQNVTILDGNYDKIYPYVNNDSLIYYDPPYRPISATSNFVAYCKEKFGDDAQITLATFYKTLHNEGCNQLLSNSHSDFFYDLYKEFEIIELDVRRNVAGDATKRGFVKEIIIKNY